MGFEPTLSAGERLQTYALDRAATGTGFIRTIYIHFNQFCDQYYEGIISLSYISYTGRLLTKKKYL